MMSSRTRGVVYVAWGPSFLKEAEASARQLKKHGNLPCVLMTDGPAPEMDSAFDQIIQVPFAKSYRDKIHMRRTPFDETLFLDTDTLVLGSLDPLFALLERFDVFFQAASGGRHYKIDGIPMESFPEPSAGVIGWRKNAATEKFFDEWELAYDQEQVANGDGAWDQRSLRAAAWRSNVQLTFLTAEWQLCPWTANVLLWPVKIVHGRSRKMPWLVREANRIDDYRVFVPAVGALPLHLTTAPQYARFLGRAAFITVKTGVRSLLDITRIWPRPNQQRPM